MDPRGTVGRIYKENLHTYLQTKKKAQGLVVLEKKIFLCLSYFHDEDCKSVGANDPRGMVGRIYKEDDYTLLGTKYESSGPCGVGEQYFFVFPMMPPGRGPYEPQGHGWQDL